MRNFTSGNFEIHAFSSESLNLLKVLCQLEANCMMMTSFHHSKFDDFEDLIYPIYIEQSCGL
jgi:hypothetical protein